MDERLTFPALELPTLILNKRWQAIDALPVREALGSVCSDRAAILHPEAYTQHDFTSWMQIPVQDGEPFIRMVGGARVKVPEIVVLKQFDRERNLPVVFSRRNLWKRDKYCCQYCGKRPPPDEITIDHVLPKSRGGTSSFTNCVLACVDCNKRKDNRTPEEAHMRLFRMGTGPKGELVRKYYTVPKAPYWSPFYAVRRQHVPVSWNNFVKQTVDDLYWDTELEA